MHTIEKIPLLIKLLILEEMSLGESLIQVKL